MIVVDLSSLINGIELFEFLPPELSSGGTESFTAKQLKVFLVSLYVALAGATHFLDWDLEFKIKLNYRRKENKQKIAFRSAARKKTVQNHLRIHMLIRGIVLSKRCYATAQILTQTIPLAFLFIPLHPRSMLSFYIRLARVTQIPVNYLFYCSFCIVDSLCNYLPFLRQFSPLPS